MNKEEANRKAKAIFEKWKKEKDRIEKEAKANGIWNYTGLDTNNYLFKELEAKTKEELRELNEQVEE